MFHIIKPAPDIYLACAKALAVPADICVVIEDAPAGIKAAHAAGMKCIGVLSSYTTRASMSDADFIVENLENIQFKDIHNTLKYKKARYIT